NELVDNIYQHSDFKNALVMAQRYENKKFTEICFFDDGITIKGSFLKNGIKFNDTEAIIQALKGVSSKNKERGYGLSSNLNLFINGLGGEVLIISGIGAIYWSKTAQKIYKLPDIYKLKGTLISIRIPYPVKMVDIYDYID
ncbi:MAG: ATP-binding protein, partial [Nanohaloarchaea archaeon]|nr:ATP-binding protein [Candidatus Nanohaloarchaea archaeon]